jgi:hypothetical protein
MSAKHTELPWYVSGGNEDTVWVVSAGVRMPVAECPRTHGESYATIRRDKTASVADAAYIVRACNNFPKLLEACRAALHQRGTRPSCVMSIEEQLRRAIADAEA